MNLNFKDDYYQTTVSRAESILEQNYVNYDVQRQNVAIGVTSNNSEIRSLRYRVVDDSFSGVTLPTIKFAKLFRRL